MVFSNLFFLYVFLPACVLLYFLSPTLTVKNYVLLLASLIFYALGEPVYILILIAASFSAFFFARLIDKRRGTKNGVLLLTVSVCINVSFLFFFKYFPLFVETFNTVFRASISLPRIAMPIGISIYTFQILTYTVDVYTAKTPVQNSFSKFLLYVSMFPQLIAGPIVRYSDIEAQLGDRRVTVQKFAAGVVRFSCGLAKKVIIADYAGKIADSLLLAPQLSTVGTWVGILMYTFQIYFDFSGYSDMAIGLGRMFGFDFLENFDYPYVSKSITEFWRRWHMSLGTFFRDYVYIPLGGNRKRPIINIAVVWALTGFWHGASWNFALWGVYFGFLLIFEKYVLKKIKRSIPVIIKWLYSFLAVIAGWVVFYYTDIKRIAFAFRAMLTYRPADFQTIQTAKENIVFLLVCLFASLPFAKRIYLRIISLITNRSETAGVLTETALSSVYTVGVLTVCTIMLIGSTFSPFLYFRF